jgi:hypothetical protein
MLLLAGAATLLVLLVVGWRSPTAWFRWGLVLRSCPDGQPVPMLELRVGELKRGEPGRVVLDAAALLPPGGRGGQRALPLHRAEPSLALVGAEGAMWALEPDDGWMQPRPGRWKAELSIPTVPDGDYRLVAHVDTPMGRASAEIPADLYAPAIVHLATDRPLYEPGQVIRFRAVTLGLADLAPLDGRPGLFVVKDPDGVVLLEERVPAGQYGVAASDLPLSVNAPVGEYEVGYRSGAASDWVDVKVEPFQLPRFAVELRGDRSWYAPGQGPRVEGTLRYHSGAPVRDARIELRVVGPSSGWPLPTSWRATRHLRSDGDGSFVLQLEEVPEDLQSLGRASVEVVATDAAGERVVSGLPLLLSADPITVQAETEMGDGLVPDLNNRVYLRVTTPDGLPLAGVDLGISRAWESDEEAVPARTDADGVAAFQLDPGQPGSVLVPPQPVRPPLPVEQSLVSRVFVDDLYSPLVPSIDERVALDAWNPALEICADLVPTGQVARVELAVRLDATGRVVDVLDEGRDLDLCMARRVRGLRGFPGVARLYDLVWELDASPGAQLEFASLDGAPSIPAPVRVALDAAVQRARPCVLDRGEAAALPLFVAWRGRRGSDGLELRWERAPDVGGAWRAAELACVRQAVGQPRLSQELGRGVLGSATLRVVPDPALRSVTRSATVRSGYELRVAASVQGEPLGETTVVLSPGRAPALRLRPERPVLTAGSPVRIRLLRGPGFSGNLPDPEVPVPLELGGEELCALSYDPVANVLVGELPEDPGLHGLLSVSWQGVRAVILVPRPSGLELDIAPEQARVRPGEQARLAVTTAVDGQGSPAAVSLFGVDRALGQLAPLLGPDDFGRVTVLATTRGSAFGVFDARDLLTGDIAGENAVLATLLRMDRLPLTRREEEPIAGSGSSVFDAEVVLTEAFYALLGQALREVARWEEQAAPGVLLSLENHAELWAQALEHQKEGDLPCADAFGLPLTLDRLPDDLLRLTDPRWLVSDARRLPEDVQDWVGWVRSELP